MSVKVTLDCDGQCGAEPLVLRPRRTFRTFSGKIGGWGEVVTDNYIEMGEAAGWWVFDPHTYCTYCPKCKEEILAPEPARDTENTSR